MYKVYRTQQFERDFDALDAGEKQRIRDIEDQLASNPTVGDALSYPYFREKRMNGKRIYFLIYEDENIVLVVAMSDKKSQQATIDKVTELLPEYKKAVEQLE